MAGLFVGYAGADTTRKPSANVWKGIDWLALMAGHIGGVYDFDDFTHLPATANRYTLVEADGSIAGLVTETGGVLRMTSGGTDNNECYIGGGVDEFMLGKFDAGQGRLAFEARVRFQETLLQGAYIGLGEEAFSAANAMVDDTMALVDKDFVGFHILDADSDGLDAVHQTASGGGRIVHKDIAQLIVADTWYKLGIAFIDPTIFWFINGVVVDATGVKESATDFPDGEELHVQFGVKTSEGTTKRLDIDWWRFAQLDPP